MTDDGITKKVDVQNVQKFSDIEAEPIVLAQEQVDEQYLKHIAPIRIGWRLFLADTGDDKDSSTNHTPNAEFQSSIHENLYLVRHMSLLAGCIFVLRSAYNRYTRQTIFCGLNPVLMHCLELQLQMPPYFRCFQKK